MTEKIHSPSDSWPFPPVFVINVIFNTFLWESRVLQEAAVQQIVLLPVPPGCCFQQEWETVITGKRNASKQILVVVDIMGLKDKCIILVAYKDAAQSQGRRGSSFNSYFVLICFRTRVLWWLNETDSKSNYSPFPVQGLLAESRILCLFSCWQPLSNANCASKKWKSDSCYTGQRGKKGKEQ